MRSFLCALLCGGTRTNVNQNHLFDASFAHAWIDGASSGNPGPAGVGVVIKMNGQNVGCWQEYIGKTTNNVAEYRALIVAMEKSLNLDLHSLMVHTDSELLYRQLIGKYKVRTPHIADLYMKVQELKKRFAFFKIVHVPRKENKEADRLARAARKGK